MMGSAQSENDIPLEASIPDSAASLESILRMEEFHRRPCRPPDYEKENRALGALMSALVASPGTILQTLAEKVLEALPADSAGLSLLTKDEKSFYWPAIAGAWQPHIGGGTPRDFGPCGDVLDRNVAMLFTHWERRYPYLRPATPLAEEGLLVPFYVNGKAVGTIWAIAHNDRRKFDAEDLRLLESLGRFASAAYQAVASIDDLKFQIVEREKAETALRELATGLQAKIRCLVDSNIIGIIIWDLDGRITDANDAFLHMVGYDREDLVAGRIRWTDLTPPEWLDRDARQLVPELKRAGILPPFEKEYFRKDGSRVPVLIGVASFEVSGNEGVAFVLDLTERKRGEEALRESERRYRNIFETAGVSIWEEDFSEVEAAIDTLKAQGVRNFRQYMATHPEFVRQAVSMVKIVNVNDATVKLFGAASKRELLGSLHAIFTPETEKVFAEELIAVAEERTSFASETSIQTLKGEKLAVLFTMTFPPQPAKLNSVLVTLMDITERKRAEILTAQVFESAPDGICIIGRDYRYRRANPVYSRRWGMPAERIVGMHVSELLGVDAFERILKSNLDRCFAGEEVTFEWLSESRGRLYLAVSYSPLRSGSEDVEAALSIQRDLTEYMRTSEELRAAQAELAHVNRVATMGQLTASIAHEVNQPIAATVTGARAALRWLDRRPADLEEARQALAQIVKDGIRAGDVIGRIRDLIRKAPPRKDRVEINEAIREVIELTRGEAVKNGVSVQTKLANGLPLIHGDRVQLQQVLLNLIINAVEAMSEVSGGARELVVSTGKAEAGGVLVAVRDSGPGLAPATLERLFEPFYTTKPSGVGLGLPICRSIIEAHGGRLWASPNVPRGAIFHFTVPEHPEIVLS
jgi:PAS domain S-box-containing protein